MAFNPRLVRGMLCDGNDGMSTTPSNGSAAALLSRGQGLAKVTGPDRVSWLQGMVSNDVGRLKTGEGCYAAHLSPQGKVVAQMLVLATDESLLLELESANAANAVEAMDKLLIMEDAQIADLSGDVDVISVVGSGAASVIDRWAGRALDLEEYGHAELDGVRVVHFQVGFDLIVPAARADKVSEALVEAGALAADSHVWVARRVEAGLPEYGVDVDGKTTLPELGEAAIDYDKGCYIGQEVVAKIKYIGHVNRRFVGLTLTGDGLPVAGSVVERDGKQIGHITSAVVSPTLGSAIALGYVRYGSEKAGTEVRILSGESSLPAVVTDLPFVNHH